MESKNIIFQSSSAAAIQDTLSSFGALVVLDDMPANSKKVQKYCAMQIISAKTFFWCSLSVLSTTDYFFCNNTLGVMV